MIIALAITCTMLNGSRTFQEKAINWSIRKRGISALVPNKMKMKAPALASVSTICKPSPTSSPKGQFQPPRNTTVASMTMRKSAVYSARKNIPQRMPLYSTK